MNDNLEQKTLLQIFLEHLIIGLIKNWISIALFFIYFLLSNKEMPIFTDLFRIQSIQAKDYFNVIISTTASIFGIVVTVVLLTFELSKHTLFKRIGGNILNNSIVRNFISLGVVTILLSIASYVLIPDFSNGKNITIAYYVSYLFILFVVLIYPVMKSILYSTSGLRKVLKSIHSLKVEDFDVNDFDSNSISLLENDETPFFLIKAELISSIRDNDFETYNLILKALNWRIIDLIGDGSNRSLVEKVQRGLVIIWKGGNFEAVRVGSYQYFDAVWDSILTIYINAIEKKHPYLHYQEIGFFFLQDFLSFLGRNKLHDNLSTAAKTLSNIFRFSLQENCPQENLLEELYGYFKKQGGVYNIDASLQWDYIIDFGESIFEIQKIAIENNDRTLYENCERELSIILSRISNGEISNLGELQIAYLIIDIVRDKIYNAETALQSKLFDKKSNPFKLEKYMLERAIKEEKVYTQYIMTSIGDFIIKCQRQRTLYSIGLLDEWGALSRIISEYFKKNEMAKKAINYIIETLEVMKREIENTQLPDEVENYDEIKKIIKSLRDILLKDNGELAATQAKKLKDNLDSFKALKRDKEYYIVAWERN
ncbi:hypothetical protein FRZ67_05355 [Panacibacter ginsenosidivorans]|uniref:DUF2254 domain-containing protein n=1 Tax=Panacibacter ginsenosidivorans TaxID=1813871 RepID=A0A5B8V5I3_9BACT|nr:hypothetical protein [Panacibacter ginsenosidivorans]QEC66757.1 hypothetical protein FRZ67_05355 [Panacibacter ginsenosidivorans]